jgi:menaquinone-9 beta-reductase
VIRDVAIVGGGPAGAIVATLLARAGLDVVLLERAPAWRWRACGVFTSPPGFDALRRVSPGLFDDPASIARPIPAMRVETRQGVSFRLTYGGTGSLANSAVGLDRARLDGLLLDLARAAGADVRLATRVLAVELASVTAGGPRISRLVIQKPDRPIAARVIVGADGRRSVVARDARVGRRPALSPRVGLTFHLPDPFGMEPHDARMIVIDDGYVGLAPVPGSRLNVGIVLGSTWRDDLRRQGPEAVARLVVERLRQGSDPVVRWELEDSVAGAWPLGHRVTRRAGEGWLLVGDAAGFLDPFTGEGLHRAIVSAEVAAGAVADSVAAGVSQPLMEYDRLMEAAFGIKDRVTSIVQLFLGLPPVFEYAARRLASRPDVRETLAAVIGDLAPARRAFDPGFLAAMLRP